MTKNTARRVRPQDYCDWCGRKKIILLDETRWVCPIPDCDQFSGDDNPFDSLSSETTLPEFLVERGLAWRK